MDVYAEDLLQNDLYRQARFELDKFLSSQALSDDLVEEIRMHFDFQWSNTLTTLIPNPTTCLVDNEEWDKLEHLCRPKDY